MALLSLSVYSDTQSERHREKSDNRNSLSAKVKRGEERTNKRMSEMTAESKEFKLCVDAGVAVKPIVAEEGRSLFLFQHW